MPPVTAQVTEQAVSARDLVSTFERRGQRMAVVDAAAAEVTYAELARRIRPVRDRLRVSRRLVVVEGTNTLPCLVGYLAALAADCPVLLVGPGQASSTPAERYDPDVVLRDVGGELQIEELRPHSAHRLHPDLALLLSTSGSSGSPKLVRLSKSNLLANAAAIAEALSIRSTDRAVTTLPLHYCYGLSVVHSHLLRGAALVLTDLSVLDTCFWDLFRRSRVTTLAAVPYTFDLLDRVGFADMELPSLRSVTQAGGRLAPERVRAYARLGARSGWDLHVMYGQTEATARMAVLPPALAESRPDAIGRPIPGGTFTLEPVGGDANGGAEVGELVYSGPNVMMGYATSPGDLALGATLERLRTGDLARRGPDGLYEVVGRRSRFAKLFGLRVDQGHLEDVLRGQGIEAVCEQVGERLGVLVEGPATPARVVDRVVAATGLPQHAVAACAVDRLPRTPSGKPDLPAVRRLLARRTAPVEPAGGDVRVAFEDVLGVPVSGTDSFVTLGGDSLSYVEMSVRLEEALGALPADWHLRTVDELRGASSAPGRSRRRHVVDTTVALRAAAIVLVVGSHANVFSVLGGAHLLLLLAGYNLARFQLASERRDVVRSLLRSTRRIVAPAVTWVAGATVLLGAYRWSNVVLLNAVLGPQEWSHLWYLWYLEALVWLLLLVAALLAFRSVDRWRRRWPFGFALTLVGVGLLVRFSVVEVPTGPNERFTAQAVLWLFALGWAAAVVRNHAQRLLVAALGAWGMLGWFGDSERELVVLAGLAVLLAVPSLPSLPWLTRAAGVLAGSSLYVYVTHWQVYPHWEHSVPLFATAASFAVGIAYWKAWEAGTRWMASRRRGLPTGRHPGEMRRARARGRCRVSPSRRPTGRGRRARLSMSAR